MTTFTVADLMQFPADAVPELPLDVRHCGRCDTAVTPFEQATAHAATGVPMRLSHYQCPVCGCVWGRYFPEEML